MRINEEIALELEKTAKLLAFKGENRFKLRALRIAAEKLRSIDENISEINEKGGLEQIPSIGKGVGERIKEYLEKGYYSQQRQLEKEIPSSVIKIMDLPGMGPARARKLYRELGIKSIMDLKVSLRNGKISSLEGFGKKSAENIAESLKTAEKFSERILISEADDKAEEIIKRLNQVKGVRAAEAAGSIRRRKETIGDIDILFISSRPGGEIIREIKPSISDAEIIYEGRDKVSFTGEEGVRVDLRRIKKEAWGSAMQYFTGSTEHSLSLRKRAKKLSFKLNEYGLFKGNKKIAAKSEKEIYEALGMSYIPPELREDSGEIELALNRSLPRLVQLADIRGDFHIHSLYSDGGNSIREIADAAGDMGYEWVGVCDHSQSLKIAGGLDLKALEEKMKDIENINKKSRVEILCGQEVDIMSDGSLDYPDGVLCRLDLVIAAVHTGFGQSREKITSRVLKAMENPYVNIIAHPTGRLLNEREAYDIDMETVIEKAAETGTFLEINAYPRRLDISSIYARRAGERNVKMAAGTDAHHKRELRNMKYAVDVARRGWLEKKSLINTIPLGRLKKILKKKRKEAGC